MTLSLPHPALFVACLCAASSACRERETTPATAPANTASASPTSAESGLAASSAAAPAVPTGPTQRVAPAAPAEPAAPLFTLPVSAYQASLAFDDQALYLLTPKAVYRLGQGEPRELRLDLGTGAAATRSSLVYWSKGRIFKAPKEGGRPRELAKLSEQPQFFVSSADDFGWIARGEDHLSHVRSLRGREPLTLYTSAGRIGPAAMLNDWVFFVDLPTEDSWRIGGVSARGGEPTFTETKAGAYPYVLYANRDLYYYDSKTRDVTRLSPDLRHSEIIAKDFICSPIAAYDRVYCAQPGRILEVGGGRGESIPVEDAGGLVTSLAVDATRLAWISDAGTERLAVRMIPRAAAQ